MANMLHNAKKKNIKQISEHNNVNNKYKPNWMKETSMYYMFLIRSLPESIVLKHPVPFDTKMARINLVLSNFLYFPQRFLLHVQRMSFIYQLIYYF